ncbi:MAG: iron ABC transporter permease, partial [Candidatus Electrothrix sp. AX2]|nr:iron ABC transporter permease [Candidatus Electrothrix gigas]
VAGVILILTITYTPLVTAVVRAGLHALDSSQEDAAALSASSVKVMLCITLPRLHPYIISSSLVVMLLAMANYDVPDLLRVKVIPVEIFIQLSAMYDETGALLLALPYLVVTGILIFLVGRMAERRRFTGKSSEASPKLEYSTLAEICIVLLQFVVFTVTLFIPLAILLTQASAVENIWLILKDSLSAITYTLLLSGCSAAVALCCAFPLSYLLARQHPLRNSIHIMVLVPFVLPGVLIGLSLIQLGNLPLFFRLHSTSYFCVTALVSHFLFIAIKVLQAGIEQIPSVAEEAAACSTGKRRKIIQFILLPQLLPGVISSFFIVFICSFGELSAMLLLVPPGRETVALKIYNMMHYGAEDIVATLCLFITLILLCSGWLVLLCQKMIRSRFLKSVQ